MLKKKIFLGLIFLYVIVPNLFSQSAGEQWLDFGLKLLKGTWDGIVQYNRVMENTNSHFENEIQQGLGEGLYTNNINNSYYARVYIIFNKLLASEHLQQDRLKYNWRIYIVNTNVVNAFASVNGIIGINRGLINFCQNDDEIAMILGHEIAHMVKNHLKQRVATSEVKTQILNLLSSYVTQNNNSITDKAMFDRIFGFAGNMALMSFSRANEEEADREGAKYAASVGYDPNTGYDLWRRMSSPSNRSLVERLLATHPYSEDRANTFITGNYKLKYYNPYFVMPKRQDSDLAIAYNMRGVEFYNAKDYEKAAANFAQASNFNPNDTVIQNNLKNANTNITYERNKNAAYAHNERGLAYLRNGGFDEAILELTEANWLNPNDIQIRNNLAAAYNERGVRYYINGNFTDALLDFVTGSQLNPNDKVISTNRENAKEQLKLSGQ